MISQPRAGQAGLAGGNRKEGRAHRHLFHDTQVMFDEN